MNAPEWRGELKQRALAKDINPISCGADSIRQHKILWIEIALRSLESAANGNDALSGSAVMTLREEYRTETAVIEARITSHFMNNIRCRRRVPNLIRQMCNRCARWVQRYCVANRASNCHSHGFLRQIGIQFRS